MEDLCVCGGGAAGASWPGPHTVGSLLLQIWAELRGEGR